MKKFLGAFLLFVFSVFMSSVSFAVEDRPYNAEIGQLYEYARQNADNTTKATFSSNNGLIYEMNVYQLNTDTGVNYVASTDDMKLVTPMTRGGMNEGLWAASDSVYFSLSIQYNTSNSGILLTSVSGSITISQSGCQVTNQHVIAQCNNPAALVNSQTIHRYPTSTSFSYNTGFSSYVPAGDMSYVGAVWTATVKKGSSSWNVNLPCMRYGL